MHYMTMLRNNLTLFKFVFGALIFTLVANAEEYWETARGFHAKPLSKKEVSTSLSEVMGPDFHIPVRYSGINTHDDILRRKGRPRQCHEYECYQFFPGQPLTLYPYLDGVYNYGNTAAQPGALIDDDPLSSSMQYVKSKASRIGFTYSATTVLGYTGFSGSSVANGQKSYGSNHSSVIANWVLLRDRRDGTGIFATTALKQGNGFDFDANNENPAKNIGAIRNPAGYYQHQGAMFNHVALGYVGAEGRLVAMGGMIDLGNYMDCNIYTAGSSNGMVNKSFSNTATLPVLAGLGFHLAWQPVKEIYLMIGSVSGNTPANHNPFDYLSANNWVNMLEIGLVYEDVMGLGQGIYRFIPHYATVYGESGCGFSINFQQQLGKKSSYGWFLRSGLSDSVSSMATNVKLSVATGFVVHAPFSLVGTGSETATNHDGIGLGFLWSQAPSGLASKTNTDEIGVELSYIAQITPTMTIQPDIQVLKNPIMGKRKGQTNVVFQVQSIWQF